MKVPPKRKGNPRFINVVYKSGLGGLNESPSEKEGKFQRARVVRVSPVCLNESPSEKEGKSCNAKLFVALSEPPQ